ncbi:hypothetical protein NQ317_017431, partial [Molorchus minor]
TNRISIPFNSLKVNNTTGSNKRHKVVVGLVIVIKCESQNRAPYGPWAPKPCLLLVMMSMSNGTAH